MKFFCDRCGEEIKEPGALVFAPPSACNYCIKQNLCMNCWIKLAEWMKYAK